jgi:hypothetical protein
MPPRKPATPTATAIHRVYGECIPIQRITTEGGMPVLKVRCSDGIERTILLSEKFWVTPIARLLKIPSSETTTPNKLTAVARRERPKREISLDDWGDDQTETTEELEVA